jgi:EAL domain-containing protein (putative c-di-GMP-specific phosphodiesterase class I)
MGSSATVVTSVELLRAVQERELVVEFQPIVPIQSPPKRRAVLEALVRWDHPRRGRLVPAAFLDAASSTEVCDKVTSYVMRNAGAACRDWVDLGWDVGVAVNVWPTDLVSGVVRQALDEVLETGLAPDRLTLEVTEGACDLDDVSFVRGLVSIARLGVRLSLDDFGTGDSTLSRLRHVHFDEVKVDRMFVTDAASDPTDRAIFRFSVQLAHALGMEAVAEGIETPAALALAREVGAEGGQGYLFAKSAPRASITPPFRRDLDLRSVPPKKS